MDTSHQKAEDDIFPYGETVLAKALWALTETPALCEEMKGEDAKNVHTTGDLKEMNELSRLKFEQAIKAHFNACDSDYESD